MKRLLILLILVTAGFGQWAYDYSKDPMEASILGDINPLGNHLLNEQTTTNMMSKGTVYRFDGVDDFVEMNALATHLNNPNNTVGMIHWVGTIDDLTTALDVIWSFGDTNDSEFLSMGVNETNYQLIFKMRIAATWSWTFTTDNLFSEGTEYIIDLVHDGTAPILYVNGVLEPITFVEEGDKTDWLADATAIDNMRLGCLNFNIGGNSNFAKGSCSKFSYFNFAPTASEVKDLVSGNLDFSKQYGSQTNLVTGTDSDFSGANSWSDAGTLIAFDVNSTVAGKGFLSFAGSGNKRILLSAGLKAGKEYFGSCKVELLSGSISIPLKFGADYATGADDDLSFDFTPTGAELTVSGRFFADSNGNITIGYTGVGDTFTMSVDDVITNQLGATFLADQTSISETYWYDKANGNDGAVTGASVLNYKGAHTDGTDLIVDNDIMGEGGFAIYENGNPNQLYLATGGKNIMGHNASISTWSSLSGESVTPQLQVVGDQTNASQLIGEFSANPKHGTLTFLKSRNTTLGSNTVVADDDRLGAIQFVPADGNDFNTVGAQIVGRVNDVSPTANQVGTDIEFYTALGGANDDLALSAKIHKDAMLDLYGGTISILAGADSDAKTRTNATTKRMKYGIPHYTTAEEPFAFVFGTSDANNNSLYLGGNASDLNAASLIAIFAADDQTTTTGTEVARFEGGASKALMMGLGNSALQTWNTNVSVLSLGSNANIWAHTDIGASKSLLIAQNDYHDGSNSRYISTDEASKYIQTGGAHNFYVASSGTAGNVISYTTALTIANDASSTFGGPVTITSPNYLITNNIKATGASGLYLRDQSENTKILMADGANGLITLSGGTGGVRLDNSVGIGVAPFINGALNIGQTYTSVINANYHGIYSLPVFTTFQGASTHPIVANLRLDNMIIGGHADAVITNLATLYIDNAPSISAGTVTNGPYSIFVDAGDVRIDDTLRVTGGFIAPTQTPASASATGTTGQIAWDASYIYVCVATDTWKRTAIATW